MENLISDIRTLTVVTVMTLGLGGGPDSGQRCPASVPAAARPAPKPRPRTAQAPAPRLPLPAWMDYIDFRRGSGDILRDIGRSDGTAIANHGGVRE